MPWWKKPSPTPGHGRVTQRSAWRRWTRWLSVAVVLLAGLLFLRSELASRASAAALARYVRGVTFALDSGRSRSPAPPGVGPLDVRLGYTKLPAIVDSLEPRGFRVIQQATVSDRFVALSRRGFFPPYEERTQAGLTLLDRNGARIATSRFPASVYEDVDQIPASIRETLLFLENRELLDDRDRYRNPAVDWDRFVAAGANFVGARVLGSGGRFGASTLATQLEKVRHSRDGVTRTAGDKARQMASATMRSYLHGPVTVDARRRILLDYVNSLPLGAVPGYGEVVGVREGFRRAFDINPDSADAWLRTSSAQPSPNAARAYRAAVMLLLGQRRPSYYLQSNPGRAALVDLTQSHLRLIEQTQIVTPALARAAQRVQVDLVTSPAPPPRAPFIERKATNAVRSRVAELVGAASLYELDRYDLEAVATIDSSAQGNATALLRRLANPEFVAATGLNTDRLLGNADPARVSYSLLLYERTPIGNAVRLQVDNLDRPFDLNFGARIELGSTAKLRTLVSYLELVREVHVALTDSMTADTAVVRLARDPITTWVRAYLETSPDSTLGRMLAAAMERRYSARPDERFFTGGGVHVFRNFDRTHDRATPTVAEGFRHSINLVFIRLMHDVVRYHQARLPGYASSNLEDPDDPLRRQVLEQYADAEGRIAIERFVRRHRGLATDSSVALMLRGRLTPNSYGRLLRAIEPNLDTATMRMEIRRRFPSTTGRDVDFTALERALPSQLTLADRAFVTRTDPLELWVVGKLRAEPAIPTSRVHDESATAIRDAYAWLFRRTPAVKRAQDRAIQVTLERDAFQRVLTSWRRLGYPYSDIVPSYGTAIGSSGDRPGALADLVGILVANGLRFPPVHVAELHFAKGTPFEVLLRRDPVAGDTVLSPDVAAASRAAMEDVVASGTASGLRDAIPGLAIGGKTGTGDNIARTYGAGGRQITARTVSRTATFAFSLGDRFFGVATAYVEGAQADRYNFTSGLPVRVVRLLIPELGSLLGQ
jgi:membrane peptidoglycan carboxypeptidase